MTSLRFVRRLTGYRGGIRYPNVVLMVGIALVLGVVWCEAVYAQDEDSPNAAITLEAPAQVETGAVISVTLRLSTPLTVGGWEAELRFDPAGAEFAGFYPAAPAGESSVGRLLLPQLPTGSAVGVYTCATAPCLERREVQAAGVETDPSVLGVVELLALTPGAVEVALSHVQVVDAAGNPLPVSLAADRVTVQVGSGSDRVVAPASAWPARTGVAVAADVADVAAADVTGGGGVDHADVLEAARPGGDGRENGDPCGRDGQAVDINGDGCVDIADVQIVAALAGPADLPAEPQPPAPSEQDESAPRLYVPFITGQGATEAAGAVGAAGLTFVVNSTLDESDAKWGNGVCLTASGVCTLRAAIAEANAQPGANAILFNIPGSGVHTIQLGSRLPTINDEAGGVLIDGYSQPGATANTDPSISNAQLRIELRGNGSEQFDALAIISAGNTVRGLAIYNCKRAFWVYGVGAHDNVIVGNFIGTDAAGSFRFTVTSQKQAHGVHVEQGAYGNRIGGVLPAERNVVAGNARHGVGFWHVGTNENVIYNNLVGLSPNGQGGLSNRVHGIDLNYGASYNVVGGVGPGERNVIAGNNGSGAEVSHTGDTTQNQIIGNYIGTDAGGNAAPAFAANGGHGVSLKDRVASNLVAHNVVGGSRSGGVFVDNFGTCCTSDNVIEHNRVGIGVNGGNIPNSLFGIAVNAPQTRIGPGNIVANNPVGVQIDTAQSWSATITQNSIFGNSGLGIDLTPWAQANTTDPKLPVLQQATTSSVTGTTCAGCVVEIFIADAAAGAYGEGRTFVGNRTAAADGSFVVAVTGVQDGDAVTATATDAAGSTTEYALNLTVAEPKPWQQVFAVPGRIEAEDYREGGEGTGYHDTTAGNSGRVYRNDGVDIEVTQDANGAYDVGWIAPGEWLAYAVNVAQTGTYQLAARMATPSAGKRFYLAVDGANVSGSVTIPWTGGWQNWVNVTVSLPLTAGPHAIRLVAETDRFNVNYLDFAWAGN